MPALMYHPETRKLTLNQQRQLILGRQGARCCCGGDVCTCGRAFPVYRWQCDPLTVVPVGGERRWGAVVYELFELIQLQANTVQVGRFADSSQDYSATATEIVFAQLRGRVCVTDRGVALMPGLRAVYDSRIVSVYNGESQTFQRHEEYDVDTWGPGWTVFELGQGPIVNGIATLGDSVTLGGGTFSVGVQLPPGPCVARSEFNDQYDRSAGDLTDRGSVSFGGQASVRDDDQSGVARAYHTYSGNSLRSDPAGTETVAEYTISTHIASWGRELRCPADPPLTGGRLALLAGRASGRSSVEGCVGCGDGGA